MKKALVLRSAIMKATYPVMTVTQAQSDFPKLCREGKRILITKRDKPVSVLLPIDDYEAMMETMDLLSNPGAMKTLRAAKAGKLTYRVLDLDDENFGL
jgi:prevent-host-death family protein